MRAKGVRTQQRRVPPLDCMWKKLSTQIFLETSKNNSKNGLSNFERNKVMKNQPIRGIPRGLAYNNQAGGVDLTPPHVE